MKGLYIRIDPKLDRSFTQICQQAGYKKGAIVASLIREFVYKKRGGLNPIQMAKDFGIDTTLLERNLHKSPTERLEDHAQFASFIRDIRKKR